MPNKTKAKRRKAARPDEIIKAALEEFAEKGFAAAKLENVARRAGVVKGTIYRYFPSKTALFEAALQPQVAPVIKEGLAMIDSFPGNSEQLLRMVIARIYQQVFSANLIILIRIIVSEGARFPEIAKLYHDQTVLKGLALLEKIIKRGVERGEFQESSATEMPLVIVAPLIATGIWTVTFGAFAPLDVEKMAKAHVDLILNGIKTRDKK